MYSERLFESGPHFVMFVKMKDPLNHLLLNGLKSLEKHYNSTIKFSWIAFSYNEKIRMAFGITSLEMTPRMFYISEGMVYAFD